MKGASAVGACDDRSLLRSPLRCQLNSGLCVIFKSTSLVGRLAIGIMIYLLVFSFQAIALNNQNPDELERTLINFGCDHESIRGAMIGSSVKVDYVNSNLNGPGGLALRYRWSGHETRVVGPDLIRGNEWRWFVVTTVIDGSSLPDMFRALNSSRAREYLLETGFRLEEPSLRYPGVEQFSRTIWNAGDEANVYVHIVYSASLVSSITWNCGS